MSEASIEYIKLAVEGLHECTSKFKEKTYVQNAAHVKKHVLTMLSYLIQNLYLILRNAMAVGVVLTIVLLKQFIQRNFVILVIILNLQIN